MLGLIVTDCAADEGLECVVSESGVSLAVAVTVAAPHAGEMIIITPDGRMIWMQADHIPFLYPNTNNFVQLSEFVIGKRARGSWFNDWGEPEAVSIFSVAGTYEIFITHDAESGRQDAGTLSCKFSVAMNGN